jgi:hypothetical protein
VPDPADDQDHAENVDSEVLSDVDDDPEGSLAFPPDRPLGVEEYGTTASEERVDEPLAERLRREVPDPSLTAGGRYGDGDEDDPELIRLELGDDAADRDAGDGDDDEDRQAPVGRLVDPGASDDAFDLDDQEADAVADLAEERDLSAEEAAVHLTGAPPFRPEE